MALTGKRILLGVTGSIAAYKAVELLRQLTARGAEVQVAMTEAATRFVAPLTFETLSRQEVLLDMWSLAYSHRIGHIEATQRADLLAVAPATAQTIARFALGLADDFLSCIYLASRCPVLVAPAMDVDMFEHPALQENLGRLAQRGAHVVQPELGPLASGLIGRGRLAELATILGRIEALLSSKQDLAGRVVLVTAGPTREPIDPVRYLSNRSSGKMGYAVAAAAAARGAQTILVSGPSALAVPPGVELVRVETAQEMHDAVLARLESAHAVIKAAAVADYRPVHVAAQKLKKASGPPQITLEETPDILRAVAERKGRRILVGFAAETENLAANARQKLVGKHLDLLVANEVGRPDSGFEVDANQVTLIDAAGAEELPLLPKSQVAERILDRVSGLLEKRSGDRESGGPGARA